MRAAANTAVFFLKVYPMLPSGPVDRVTKPTMVEKVRYPARVGAQIIEVEGDLYRPAGSGPHPAVVVCLGVVPFGVDHPQVPRLGEALARSGFAALLYWSPAMRDVRLDPADIENIALAYQWLLNQPYVDPARSGLLGTCVGGSFALMASASPLIQDRVGFVFAYAPYFSMSTLALDIASSTRPTTDSGQSEVKGEGEMREPWQVDPLTRKVYVRSMTAQLEPGEAALLRNTFTVPGGAVGSGELDSRELSEDGQLIYPLLTHLDAEEADKALKELTPDLKERLDTMSPANYLDCIHAPLVVLCHDREDRVMPVSESRRLASAFGGRAGVTYTELAFQHLDPKSLSLFSLLRELGKFYLAVYPLFWRAAPS